MIISKIKPTSLADRVKFSLHINPKHLKNQPIKLWTEIQGKTNQIRIKNDPKLKNSFAWPILGRRKIQTQIMELLFKYQKKFYGKALIFGLAGFKGSGKEALLLDVFQYVQKRSRVQDRFYGEEFQIDVSNYKSCQNMEE